MGVVKRDEFPSLARKGLYAVKVAGNGNCLFAALSDQLYNTQSHALEIRLRVAQQLHAHPEKYAPFLAVHPGGGTRRNQRRRAAANTTHNMYNPSSSASSATSSSSSSCSSQSSSIDLDGPTTEDCDLAYARHVAAIAKPGTYADHIELMAFADTYGIDICVHQRDGSYIVTKSDAKKEAESIHNMAGLPSEEKGCTTAPAEPKTIGTPTKRRKVAHIAYHQYEHFSSVRRIQPDPSALVEKMRRKRARANGFRARVLN